MQNIATMISMVKHGKASYTRKRAESENARDDMAGAAYFTASVSPRNPFRAMY